jgi:hypothetical protein
MFGGVVWRGVLRDDVVGDDVDGVAVCLFVSTTDFTVPPDKGL